MAGAQQGQYTLASTDKNQDDYISLESIIEARDAVVNTNEGEGTPTGSVIKSHLDSYKAFNTGTRNRMRDLAFDDTLAPHDRQVMDSLSKLTNRVQHINIPSQELLDSKRQYYKEQLEKNGSLTTEEKTNLKHVEDIGNFARTACIMPVWHVRTDMLNYAVMYSQNLDAKFSHLSKEDHDKCYLFTQYHEVMGHLVGGDFPAMDQGTLSRVRKMQTSLSGSERNIIQDLRINSFGVRYLGRTFQNAFPGGVYGETIKGHIGHIPAAVETLHKYAHGQINEDELPNEIDKNIARWTGHDIPIGSGEQLLKNLDLEKTVTSLKGVPDLNTILEPHRSNLHESLETTDTSYTNFLHQFSDVYKKYQDGEKVFPEYETLGEVLSDIRDHLKFKPTSGRGIVTGEGGNGDPFDGEYTEVPEGGFTTVRVPRGKSNSQQRQAGDQVSEATRDMNKSRPGRGDANMSQRLPKVENAVLSDAIQTEMRRFGTLFATMPHIEYVRHDVVPARLMPVYNKYKESKVAARGSAGPTTLPRGVEEPEIKEEPIDGIMFAVVDESGSMSNEAVSAAKTALTKICGANKMAVIGVSAAHNIEDSGFSTFVGGLTNPDDFIRRFKTGGTGNFHRALYDLPKLMENEGFKKRLQDSLPPEITMEKFQECYDQKKVGMMVITDGDIPTDQPNPGEISQWNNYANSYRDATEQDEPPVTYISVTNRMNTPIQDGDNLTKTRKLNTRTLNV